MHNFKAGDKVIALITSTFSRYIKEKIYVVKAVEGDSIFTVLDSKGSKTNGMHYKHFKKVESPKRIISWL